MTKIADFRLRFQVSSGLLLFLCALAVAPLQGQDLLGEEDCLRVLQSDSSRAEKDAACVRLKHVGTARAVPALAALLTDEDLAHSARHALQSMEVPEAGAVLLEALSRTEGLLQLGIVHSLGLRGERMAAEPLGRILAGSDPVPASAAALSLGRIGGEEATGALLATLPHAREPVLTALRDALLAQANAMIGAGDLDQALGIAAKLEERPLPNHLRVATQLLALRCAGQGALSLVVSALEGEDPVKQAAALELARELSAPQINPVLTGLLPGLSFPLQTAVLEALRERGEPILTADLLPFAGSPDPAVRVATIRLLGELGDEGAVAALVEVAAGFEGIEKRAARQSLLDIRRGNITKVLLKGFTSGTPEAQSEIARALIGRTESAAVPDLLKLAGHGPDNLRRLCWQVLTHLAGPEQLTEVVGLVLEAPGESSRAHAEEALRSMLRRFQRSSGVVDPEPLLDGLSRGSVDGRAALLRAAGVCRDARIRTALRQALEDGDAPLKAAAEESLLHTSDPEMIPDLLALAARRRESETRLRIVRNCLRIAGEQGPSDPVERVKLLRRILDFVERPEEKWLLLSALSRIHHPAALELASSMLDDPAAHAEAQQAVTQIKLALE
jgi:HEAT repeat protein